MFARYNDYDEHQGVNGFYDLACSQYSSSAHANSTIGLKKSIVRR